MTETQQNGGANGSSALAKLLNQLNIPTLLLIMITGGGNFLAVKEDGRLTRDEALRVSREVHDMHDALMDFENRQKEALARATSILDNQNQVLRNQSMMLSNQQRLLNQITKIPEAH